MSRILIHDIDWLVTVDPERRIFTRGSIAIENNRIVFVGKARDCPPSFTPDEAIDGRDMLVLPGFIDTHVHNMQQLGRGLADECDLPKQLLQRLYGYEAVLTSEDAYLPPNSVRWS